MGATKNISLILPFNLYKLLKLRSQRQGIPATQIIREALSRYLKKPSEEQVK
jgi:predicted DNA-binding protein